MPEDKTRTRRTPAEIAQAELEQALKRLEKAEDRLAKARAEEEKAEADVTRAQRFAEFARSNPDLPDSDPGDVVGQLNRNDGEPEPA